MEQLFNTLPSEMLQLVERAADAVHRSKSVLAISHIDTDGITALAIVVKMLERAGKRFTWKNIHQLNSDTIEQVREISEEIQPDSVIFSDFGTGQRKLIERAIEPQPFVEQILILDHHLPPRKLKTKQNVSSKTIEVNPSFHKLSGSYDISGAGVAFLVALSLDSSNQDLSELAVVGASGDLQDYYGKGFQGINKEIVRIGEMNGFIEITRDLTFFGINTRPLPFLLEYTTEPYIPGLSGNRDECFAFFDELSIPLKDRDDNWRTWTNLEDSEKKSIIQKLFSVLLEAYPNPKVAKGIIGDVVILKQRPEKTEMRNAKEFSTLLNACGRNRQAGVGVEICLGNPEAYSTGKTLLQQHRSNLAEALRRLEVDGYTEESGMYVVNDPLTPDTIIGIVIGMAQGARIVPIDKPVIGIATNTSDEGPMIKLSGRARKSLIKRGLNLKEVFVTVSDYLNKREGMLVAEAGGHPMAAGAFIHEEHLDSFLRMTSDIISRKILVK